MVLNNRLVRSEDESVSEKMEYLRCPFFRPSDVRPFFRLS